MAQLFLGDFETGNTTQFTSASGSVVSTPVLVGSYSGRNADNNNFRKQLASEYSTIYIHGWFRWSVEPSTASSWFVIVSDGAVSSQFALYMNAGKLRMYINGNSTYYEGIRTFSKDIWYQIEVKFVTHDTTGSFIVKINGSTDISTSSIDTKNGTDTGIKSVKWQGINATGYCYVDNLSLNDSTWDRKNYVIRVSLPGYNALTDTNPDHYALYSDEDWILIKEKARGSTSIANGGSSTIAHGLSYIPYVIVFAEVSSGRWSMVLGDSSDYNCHIELNTTNLIIYNNLGSTRTFKYYIFYDQQV